MVLGLGKSRKVNSVQVEYLIHVQEIKPWPASQHLKSVKSVMLQWENDGKNSGFFTSDVGDEKVLFGECLRLPVTLCKESSKKKASTDSFQKNFLEFFVYEARKEKTAKGHLLGSAVINLADFGVIQETMAIKTPLNFKKNSKNMTQTLLYITFQPSDAPKDNSLVDKDGGSSVSGSMAEENDEEVEFAAFTDDDADDDVSSDSSQIKSSSAFQSQRNSPGQSDKVGTESEKNFTARINGKPATLTGQTLKQFDGIPVVQSIRPSNGTNTDPQVGMNPKFATSSNSQTIYRTDDKALKKGEYRVGNSDQIVDGIEDKEHAYLPEVEYEEEVLDISKHTFKDKASQMQVASRSNTIQVNRKAHGGQSRAVASNKLKHVMSNQFPSDPVKISEPLGSSSLPEKAKQNGYPAVYSSAHKSYAANGSKEKRDILSTRKVEQKPKVEMRSEANAPVIQDKTTPDNYITSITGKSKQAHNVTIKYNADMESEVEWLIEELRETAAMEASLYSAVAEHGSSTNKVHAPARRLSRFYVHAYKAKSPHRRASAARTVVSGLVLVSKSCGNDVARLSFWLSNAIVLRTIVSQDVNTYQPSAGDYRNNGEAAERSIDWKDPLSFIVAVEKVEAWIFYRIVESVWWQSMTPHMQSAAAKGSSSRKAHGKKYGLGDQDQGSFSIDIWKRAFKDACERLCPPRAGGHECGCLQALDRLVMEQLVNRLDVAMFNAVLRESAEEMPTDPVSDPISDAKVLPIPVGKSSFGSGAQLKNAIGNWSRWLTDLFGIDDADATDDNNDAHNHGGLERESPFKPFHLLNALSGLMMLPFEMLADKATRKEVCPLFSAPMIKRVLNNFSPDEFCPNPVPEEVYAALDSEEAEDARGDCITDFPCSASPTVYSPPSTACVLASIGEGGSQALVRSVSSVLKKSNTSDDELDELESPLASIVLDNSRISPTTSIPNWMLNGKGARKVVRYQLLRETWRENI